MILPTTKIEQELLAKGSCFVFGVDEAGRGPLAGPVVAGAAWVNPDVFDRDFRQRGLIRDSKTLSEKQREEIFCFLQSSEDFCLGIGEVSHAMIDRLNILNASLLAMRLAVENLIGRIMNHESRIMKHESQPETGQPLAEKIKLTDQNAKNMSNAICLLIDGNKKIPKIKHEQHLFCKGDRNVFSIAAASIAAKVHRDRLMQKYHKQFPCYGFDAHKGYGTRAHMEALQKNGPCKIHRRSFAPVREVC